ncbi:tyrosine-protein phosphatase [Collimonas sp.]|jgi:protein tyrosine/serine phosphatase|uniref:tyrosine-protein phosphatase n=1 Tax=Collimonas sp. TaxID=1963772 RepID=UPI002C478594|nr:tyrosine-protein phosphatase [Collimonas sp.]HWX02319.1 tyrosine-protein phosphatase [Collimonas sp.]
MKYPFLQRLLQSALLIQSALVFTPYAQAETIQAAVRKPEWAQAVDSSANLYLVDKNFYRSAALQPKDIKTLNALGVKTVINLRAFHADDDLLKNTGIKTVHVGINTWEINDKNVIDALRAIRAGARQGPVLLHCWHGADRTGLVSAMYRVVFQGWNKQQALEELTEGGYGYHSLWKNIPKYMAAVDIEKIRTAVANDG